MGLGTVQQVLAQLYTSTSLREGFFHSPQAVGQELGLTVDEVQLLTQLSRKQVDFFAHSLKGKRLGEIRKLLPLTQQSLGGDFAQLFWRYGETYSPTGIKKHWQDALNFCTFMEGEDTVLPWVLDVIRYEKAGLQAAELNRRFIWRRFHYNINYLGESLNKSPVSSLVLLPQPTISIWFRLSLKGEWRYFTYPLPKFAIRNMMMKIFGLFNHDRN